MATSLNLVRNSKVFFTTNVDSAGKIKEGTAFTAANTQELQVLTGFTFSQKTNAETITISEAGSAPTRGQRSFNTSLAPVDFSFSTYLRPRLVSSTQVKAEEAVLWNALLGDQSIDSTTNITFSGTSLTYTYDYATGQLSIKGTSLTLSSAVSTGTTVVLGGFTAPTASLTKLNAPVTVLQYKTNTSDTSYTTGTIPATAIAELVVQYTNPSPNAITGITGTVTMYQSAWAPAGGTSFSTVTTANSNKNQLQTFGMLFMIDQVLYAVDNCALNQVTIDFGLDAIATAAWTGQATQLRKIADAATASNGSFGGGTISGLYTPKSIDAAYITNKLSTVSLSLVNQLKNSAGTSVAANTDKYAIALTGGSLTINNNITYITPAILGIVNTPVVYYTGVRAITGTMMAYLKTGSGAQSTGELLSDLLDAASTTTEPMFAATIAIGGSSLPNRVELEMPALNLTIPAIDVQTVVSTTINFTAQGSNQASTSGTYDLTKTNDLAVRYYSTTATTA
jgi:hypothetical protein